MISSYLDRILANTNQQVTFYQLRNYIWTLKSSVFESCPQFKGTDWQIFLKNLFIVSKPFLAACPYLQGMHTLSAQCLTQVNRHPRWGGQNPHLFFCIQGTEAQAVPLTKLQLKKEFQRAVRCKKCPPTSCLCWSDKLIFLHIYSLNLSS